jgi:N-acylneuraminate cytidylyltransferase
MPEFLTIIPARGGSKNIPGKNSRLLAGKPLVAWSIEHALAAPEVGRVIVSTDNEEIAVIARQFGAEVPFMRPTQFSTDEAATDPVLLHAITYLADTEDYHPDAVILLQPTSPNRSEGALSRAITQYIQEKADCLLSTFEIHPFLWRNPNNPIPSYDVLRRPRRQDILAEERIYEENGSIYITNTALLKTHESRLFKGQVSMFLMGNKESYDIDSLDDFKILEAIMALEN